MNYLISIHIKIRFLFKAVVFLLLISESSFAQLIITPNNATTLASQLAGAGVNVFNVTYTGAATAAASFTATGTNLGLTSGIILATGPAVIAIGPNNDTMAGMDIGRPGDSGMDSLAGTQTFDAAILEFDFIPQNDTINFRYVFGSEEYPEYVCSRFNDVFAFYISGPGITGRQNMALIPGTSSAVAINSVNNGIIGTNGNPGPGCGLGYSSYYVDNTNGTTIQYDGFTTVMVASSLVIPCQVYHLRLEIADAGDGQWDSGVFMEAGSLSSTPVVDAGPDVFLCDGQTVTIGGDSVSGWQYSWLPITGLSNPFVADPTLTLNNPGPLAVTTTYTVTASKGGCVLIDELNATVTPTPSSAFIPPTSTVCDSLPVLFTYTGSAPSSANYNWTFGGGTVISGSGQGPYSVSFINTGTYSISLNVDDNGCTSTITNSQVTINDPPLAAFSVPLTACLHDTLTLNFTGQNPATTVSLWNFNGANSISGSGLGPYQLTFSQAGNYDISLDMNETGCAPSQSLQTIVVSDATANAGNDISFCSGATVSIGSPGVAGLNYAWTPSAGLSNSSAPDPTVTLINASASPSVTPFYLTASSGNCFAFDTIFITTNPVPVTSFTTVPNSICAGDIVEINFTGTAGSAAVFTWNFNQGTIISGSGEGPYQIQFSSDGNYLINLDVNDFNCDAGDSDFITVNPVPVADAGQDASMCSGNSVNIGNPLQTGDAYEWLPSAGLADSLSSATTLTLVNNTQNILYQNYKLIVKNSSGCASDDSVLVTVFPFPLLHFAAPPPQCILENNFTFSALSPVLAGTDYHWYFGPSASVDSSSSPSPSSITYPAPGNYNVTLFGSYSGCQGAPETHSIIVNPTPPSSFVPDITEGCAPLKVHFTNTAFFDSTGYSWLVEGTTTNAGNLDWTFTKAGTYDIGLTATNNKGCATNDLETHLINVFGKPLADFSPESRTADFPDSHIDFNNLSEGGQIYFWDFGDGSTENFFEGNHYFADTGFYTVRLYVTSVHGCKDTVDGQIHVEGAFSFFIPDAFTPDGDGVNDNFQGYGTYVHTYKMWIYDRWGKQIYFTDDYDKPWNGRMNSVVQNDTYVYRIAVNDFFGKDHVFVGSVSVVK